MKAFIFVTIESVLFIIAISMIRPYTNVLLHFQQARIYLISTIIKVLIKKKTLNYLDRELHTRCAGIPVMIVDYQLC